VAKWVSERTVEEVVEALVEIGVPVAPVNDLDAVMRNEQARAREMFVKVVHPQLGETMMPGLHIKMSETPGDICQPPSSVSITGRSMADSSASRMRSWRS